MKTRKVGERFRYGKRTLEVVEGDATCHGCFFENLPRCFGIFKNTGFCVAKKREDKKYVFFKEIKRL